MKYLAITLLAFFGLCACNSRTGNTEGGILWEVSGNGLEKSSYLLGTWHATQDNQSADFFDTVPYFHRVFASVGQLVSEAAITDDSYLQACSQAMYMDGTVYSQWLSDADLQELDGVLNSHLHRTTRDLNLRPYYLYRMLVQAYRTGDANMSADSLVRWGGTEANVQDIELEKRAISKGCELASLDDERTFAMLTRPLDEEMSELITFVKSKRYTESDEADTIELKSLLDAYNEQDISKISFSARQFSQYARARVGVNSLLCDSLLDITIKQRTKIWLDKLCPLLYQDSTLIAVDVRHLVDENGLIAQLRKQGFTVKPVG